MDGIVNEAMVVDLLCDIWLWVYGGRELEQNGVW